MINDGQYLGPKFMPILHVAYECDVLSASSVLIGEPS